MEEDEIQAAQSCKFPRVGNGRNYHESNKIGRNNDAYPDEEVDGEVRRRGTTTGGGGGGGGGSDGSTTNRIHEWQHHSSRIIRVSRASGGKDRHSKVMTSKGLRDRRVRLSVTTAIQFYDLQDRLGYDQPSKAVEWLIKSAAEAISELPSLNNTFPDTPKQPSSDGKRASAVGTDQQGFDSAEVEVDVGENNYHQHNNQSQNLSKSACSSTSETSKGSGLSLSRSDIRVNRYKARERARERAAKEKEKENDSSHINAHHQNINPISQTASFTELLTGGINSAALPTTASPNGDEPNMFNKAARQQQWCSSAPMDYFNTGLLGPSSSRTHHQSSSGFTVSQIQLGHNSSLPEGMSVSPFNVVSGEQNHSSDQLQQFSFIPDHHQHHHHMMPTVVTSSQQQPSGNSNNNNNDYNLNFTISSGLAGYNRGTLQSNSQSHVLSHHHLQRFSPMDGSTVPFFIGAASTPSPAPTMDNHHHHHQFSSVFDGRLQLYYGDGSRHSDQKGKPKN